MKVLIDIPQEVLENPHNYCCYALANQIKGNYTPIPDNATNGDMIKAMYPYGKYGTNGNEVHVYGVGGNGCLVFTLEWWNALYKRGNENGSN